MGSVTEVGMGAMSRVMRWGSSLAVRIPEAIAEQWGVQEGSAIEIVASGDEVVLRKRKYDLADLAARMRPEHQHPEQDWGAPQGEEGW